MAEAISSRIALVTDAHREKYREFVRHHLARLGRPLPAEVWHYTSAEGLIGILKSGKIHFTQISCLNDSLEQRYAGDLVHQQIKDRLKTEKDPDLLTLFHLIDTSLASRDLATEGHFVACFSEAEDDLGQWRGYGGGECGYAIGFNPALLTERIQNRPSIMIPMNYSASSHDIFIKDVVDWAEKFFKEGLAQGMPNVEQWAREFLLAYSIELDLFSSIIKHPKFSGEAERRILTRLQPNEHSELVFRQKRTLLARHLPLDLTTADSRIPRRLPITRIYVGPGPAQRVSQVSVGDLLLQCGYTSIKVELSQAPYRIP